MSANVARLQSDMASARRTVETAMDGIKSAAASARSALEAIGVGLSVGGVVEFVKGAIDMQNALYELNLRTGLTVETLSGLRGIAAQAGQGLDSVAGLVNKLEKNMLPASIVLGIAELFKGFRGFAGPVLRESGLQNIDTFLPEFARRLISAGVGGEQAGLAMQLIGKSGAQLLPVLHELAKATQIHGDATNKSVTAAHEFEVGLAKLSEASTQAKISFVNELLPSLNAIVESMVRARQQGEGFIATLRAGLATALTGTDQYKNDVELVDLTERKLELEQKLAAAQSGPYATARRTKLEAELDLVKGQISTTMIYRKELEDEAAAQDKAAEAARKHGEALKYAAAAAAAGAIAERDAMAIQRQRMETEAAYAKALQDHTQGEAENVANVIRTGKAVEQTSQKVGDLHIAFMSAFEKAIIGGQGLRAVMQGLLQDIEVLILRRAVTEPLANFVSGAVGGILGGAGGGAAVIPELAAGGTMQPNSWNMVGENGPELVWSGVGGGTVVPNSGIGGGTYYIDARGADSAGLARVQQQIAALHGSIEYRALGAVYVESRRNPGFLPA